MVGPRWEKAVTCWCPPPEAKQHPETFCLSSQSGLARLTHPSPHPLLLHGVEGIVQS